MATELELRRHGRMGFSEEDYEEWLRRRLEKREDVQAHEVALERMRETGLGERLGREQEFARPLETAKAGYYGAGAEELRGRGGIAAAELAAEEPVRAAQAASLRGAGELSGVRAEMGRRMYPLYGQDIEMGKLGLKRAKRTLEFEPLDYESILERLSGLGIGY